MKIKAAEILRFDPSKRRLKQIPKNRPPRTGPPMEPAEINLFRTKEGFEAFMYSHDMLVGEMEEMLHSGDKLAHELGAVDQQMGTQVAGIVDNIDRALAILRGEIQ